MRKSFRLHGEKESYAEKERGYAYVWYCLVLIFKDLIFF